MGAGFGFSFKRAYRSDSDHDTVLGPGWSHSLEQYLTPSESDMLRFDGADGRTWRYAWDATAQTFVSPAGFYDRLEAQPDGTYTITDREGIVATYTLDNGAYRLTRKLDRNGNTLVLTYDQGRLASVQDSHGRSVTFQYTEAGKLASFTDFYDPADPRVFGFTYTTEGDLDHCTTPIGVLQSYVYATDQSHPWQNHNLLQVRDDLGRTYVSVTYDEDTDRVTAEQYGDATQVYRFAYPPSLTEGVIRMTDRRNDGVWTCHRDASGHVATTELTGPSLSLTWLHEFNANGEVTLLQPPRGSPDRWTYDIANADPLRRGNLLEHRKIGLLLSDLVETWTWLESASLHLPKTFTNARGYTTTYFYDLEEATAGDLNGDGRTDQAAGKLVKIAHPTVTLGVLTPQTIEEKFWWDDAGRKLRDIDPNAKVTAYEYFATGPEAGYLHRRIEDYGRLELTTSWTVDRVGNRTSETSPRGRVTTFTIDRMNRVAQVNGALGYETDMTYVGRRMTQRKVKNLDGDGLQDPTLPWIVTDYTHTLLAEVATETLTVSATASATTTYSRDAEQNVSEVLYPSGRRDTFEHEARHLLTRSTLGAGFAAAVIRDLRYDGNGNKTLEMWSSGYSAFHYDDFNRQDASRLPGQALFRVFGAPDGQMPGGEPDSECSCACESGSDSGQAAVPVQPAPTTGSWDQPPDHTEAGDGAACGWTVVNPLHGESSDRDEIGRVYATRQMHKDSADNPIAGGESTTQQRHDPAGRVVQVTPPVGVPVLFSHDTADRTTSISDKQGVGDETVFTLDLGANATRIIHSVYNWVTAQDESLTEDRVYDLYNRMTTSTQDPGGLALTSTLKHDSQGNVVEATDAKGNHVKRTFDGQGNLRTIRYEPIDGPAITLTMEYNADGHMTSLTDGMGHMTTYVLDAVGRVERIVYADATEERFEYDGDGRVSKHTDANGTEVRTLYHPLGMPVSRQITRAPGVLGPTGESLGYDPVYRLMYASSESGGTEFSYTSLDQVDKIRYTIGELPSAPTTTTFGFDAAGHRTRMVYPNQRTLDLAWDDRGRLSSIHDGTALIAGFEYSGADLARRTYGNGLVLNITRDILRRPTDWRHVDGGGGGAVRAGFGYAYDELGLRKYRLRLHDGLGDAYRYDGLGQLTGVKAGVPTADIAPNKAYGDYPTFSSQRQYNFDAAGNRMTVDTDGVLSYYNYVNSVNVPDLMNRYRTIDDISRVHDANGNVTDDGNFTYAYNYRNQIVEARRKSDAVLVAKYLYDALGRRLRTYRIVDGQQQPSWTDFYFDGHDIIAEGNETGAFTATYVNGPGIDHPLAMDPAQPGGGTARYFYHDDSLGSICLLTDAAGANAEKYDYTEYGTPTVLPWDAQANGGEGGWGAGLVGGASSVGNSRMFTGREWSAEIGKVNFRARDFDPTAGRFISPDPLSVRGDALGSTFRYVENSPPNATDPLGLSSDREDPFLDDPIKWGWYWAAWLASHTAARTGYELRLSSFNLELTEDKASEFRVTSIFDSKTCCTTYTVVYRPATYRYHYRAWYVLVPSAKYKGKHPGFQWVSLPPDPPWLYFPYDPEDFRVIFWFGRERVGSISYSREFWGPRFQRESGYKMTVTVCPFAVPPSMSVTYETLQPRAPIANPPPPGSHIPGSPYPPK